MANKAIKLIKEQHSRGIHTAYFGDKASGKTDAGTANRARSAVFLYGRGRAPDEIASELRRRKIA